jgi:hypothetical protein
VKRNDETPLKGLAEALTTRVQCFHTLFRNAIV